MVSLLLSHLPLLQPGNTDAKSEYMKLLQKVLAYSIDSNLFTEESRQLLSYALIHPATTLDDRNALALWLNHLEERLSSSYSGQGRGRPETAYHSQQGSDEWQGPVGTGWQEKPPRENGHMAFHSSGSVPSAINSIGSNANAGASEEAAGWVRGRGVSSLLWTNPLARARCSKGQPKHSEVWSTFCAKQGDLLDGAGEARREFRKCGLIESSMQSKRKVFDAQSTCRLRCH